MEKKYVSGYNLDFIHVFLFSLYFVTKWV